MRFVGMCVGLTWVMGLVGQVSAAPVQWAGNGHFYEVVSAPGSLSWEAASAAAVARGGTLATLTSQAENDFVFALADNATFWAGSSGPWLGVPPLARRSSIRAVSHALGSKFSVVMVIFPCGSLLAQR